MSTQTENTCLRCRKDCVPLANLSSDTTQKSFVCVGLNKVKSRTIPQDRFTLCWKNDLIDERGHWDKRDLLDTKRPRAGKPVFAQRRYQPPS